MTKPSAAATIAVALSAILAVFVLVVGCAVVGARAAGFVARRRAARIEARQAQFNRQPDASGIDLQIGGLDVSVWKPAVTGPAPLVIFSHGFHGSSRQSVFLMKALAAHGYFVIAPNHKDSIRPGAGLTGSLKPEQSFGDVAAWSDATFRDRADDIRSLIMSLKADPAWSKQIDWNEVALAGHSLGGYTVLGLAGAWPSWKLPGIKAVVALSPYTNPYIERKTLNGIFVPVMYQGGTFDFGISPFVKKNSGAYDQTPSPAYYVEFRGAGHLAWTDLNPSFQGSIVYYTEAFLDKYVKGDRSADPARKLGDVCQLRSK